MPSSHPSPRAPRRAVRAAPRAFPRALALTALLAVLISALAGVPAAVARPAAATTAPAAAPATLPATAAVAAPVAAAGTTAVTRLYVRKIGGINRAYTVISPSTGSAGRPMVVFLSGTSAGTASEVARDHLVQFVTAGLVSLVYPIGIDHQWNVGPNCCTAATTPKADDQTYVRDVTKLAAAQLHPDVKRIYLIGYSAGAKLGWQLVCARPGPFAAFASYGGNPETTCPPHGAPLPVFIGFGRYDTNEPIAGRPSDRRGVHPPAVVNVDTWITRNGCSARRYDTTTLQGRIAVTSYRPCARRGLVVAFAVWMGSTHTIPQLTVSAPSAFGTVAWQFVSRYARP